MKLVPWGLVLALCISNVLTAVVQISWRRVVETKLEECREIEGREFIDLSHCQKMRSQETEIHETLTTAVQQHLRIHNQPGGWCARNP